MSDPLSTKFEATGDFAAMVEHARNNIALEGGGELFIHRPFEMEHLEGDDCPCRPVVIDGFSLHKPETLLAEIERCDG